METLRIVDRLAKSGCGIISLQEPWVEVSGELRELLIAITGWVARMESKRLSERTRAGLDRAKGEGKRLGRPPGSGDRRKRSTKGYRGRYSR